MTRETAVIESLVAMADTLVADFDVVDLLTGLTDHCVTILGISAAGVMLASPERDLRLVASSSEAMRVLEMFELQAREGPCLESHRTGEAVAQVDLRSATDRWPRFAAAALDAGFLSVFALPLRIRSLTIGALNLFSEVATPVDQSDVAVARAFADLAAISVVQHRALTETRTLNDQLSAALESRVIIEQAKGIIAERAGIDVAEAFRRLRQYARSNNLLLTAVARAAVDATLDPVAWEQPYPSEPVEDTPGQ